MPSSAWKKDVCSRSEEHTSELQSLTNLVCRLLLEKKEGWSDWNCSRVFITGNLACLILLSDDVWKPEVFEIVFKFRVFIHCRLPCLIFFNDTATTEIYTLSLHDALPISQKGQSGTKFMALRLTPQVVVGADA